MKRIIVLSITLLFVVTLCGCSGKKESVEPETVTETPAELQGNYYEEIAGRAYMSVNADNVTINWGQSAAKSYRWDIPTSYDEAAKRINYSEAVCTDIVFESDSKSTESELYNDGTGYFEISDDKLIWHDDKSESADPVVFIKEGTGSAPIDMPNPWTETDSLTEAVTISGVEYNDPIEGSLPEGYVFDSYQAMEGLIRAIYLSDTNKLVISKSNTYTGTELSGNYHAYSKNWTISLKGLSVECYGDGETINEADFSVDNEHYAVSVYDPAYEIVEGNGITADDLQSLTMGM